MTPEIGRAKQLDDGIVDTLVSVKLLQESTMREAIKANKKASFSFDSKRPDVSACWRCVLIAILSAFQQLSRPTSN
jgi:hypothetical protein